ncbi:MAG: rhomboid family intramembrane serine protease [Chthoniobacterales bacterium]
MRLSGRKPSSFTRAWTRQPRFVLLSLISINVAAFVAQLFVDAYQPGFVRDYLGLTDVGVRSAYAWQFLSAMFLHDGMWHFVANMLVLYLVGRDVESIIGERNFLFLYLAGAIAGELGHLFLMPADTVLFGASGGVIAILFAYATILPELEFTSAPLLFVRVKAKYLAYGAIGIAILLLIIDRKGAVTHSAYLGGCAAGWLYAHLLGFGRPSFIQRALHNRRLAIQRYRQLTPEQFIAEEIDPVLDKISREGLQSLTWRERRTLAQAREKMAESISDD